MAYTKTTWVNDQSPDIDADNLNKMEQGIYDAQFPDGGTEGQLLARTANGRGWVDPPNSAVWGGITGDIADQTDLQAALSSVGKVDSVNGIEPDAQKNVQVDVEITKQGWDALPSTKYTDDINYYIKDGTNVPQAGVISASGVTYSNTSSGLDATTVQGAIDENASEIADVKSGLTYKSGDTYSFNTGYTLLFAGRLGWSKARVLFTVPMAKLIDTSSVTGISVSVPSACVVYVDNESKSCTITSTEVRSFNSNSITLMLYITPASSWSSNADSACNIEFNSGSFSFTFS